MYTDWPCAIAKKSCQKWDLKLCMCILRNIASSFHCHTCQLEFKVPLPPAKKQKILACIREIQVHKLWTKVYSQKGLTAMPKSRDHMPTTSLRGVAAKWPTRAPKTNWYFARETHKDTAIPWTCPLRQPINIQTQGITKQPYQASYPLPFFLKHGTTVHLLQLLI